MDSEDPLLGYPELAAHTGLSRATLYSYRAHAGKLKGNPLPEPDDTAIPGRPRWRRSTIDAWQARRPGQGARTDLTPPAKEPH